VRFERGTKALLHGEGLSVRLFFPEPTADSGNSFFLLVNHW
jgi:hypothetical protein